MRLLPSQLRLRSHPELRTRGNGDGVWGSKGRKAIHREMERATVWYTKAPHWNRDNGTGEDFAQTGLQQPPAPHTWPRVCSYLGSQLSSCTGPSMKF